MDVIRVIVADDHPSMCEGIRNLLQTEADIEVIGAVTTGREALQQAIREEPDVLLLDMEMPDLSGLEVARQLEERGATVRVLALSAYDDPAYVEGLLEAGATGYVTKEQSPALIKEAVRGVARGEARWFVHPSASDAPEEPLTKREEEVLRLVATGHANEEIAERLHISTSTVRNHLSSIYAKLGADSQRQAIAWAWQQGVAGK